MQNLPALLEGASVEGMQTYFGEHLDTEVPAIIVSAGPSLDKNIRMLKRAKGHAFLIGVDSALKALLREEIRPDIAISIDPGKNPELFTDDRLNELPFVVAGFSLPMIVRKNRSRVFCGGIWIGDIWTDNRGADRNETWKVGDGRIGSNRCLFTCGTAGI